MQRAGDGERAAGADAPERTDGHLKGARASRQRLARPARSGRRKRCVSGRFVARAPNGRTRAAAAGERSCAPRRGHFDSGSGGGSGGGRGGRGRGFDVESAAAVAEGPTGGAAAPPAADAICSARGRRDERLELGAHALRAGRRRRGHRQTFRRALRRPVQLAIVIIAIASLQLLN